MITLERAKELAEEVVAEIVDRHHLEPFSIRVRRSAEWGGSENGGAIITELYQNGCVIFGFAITNRDLALAICGEDELFKQFLEVRFFDLLEQRLKN